jgi:hypothetical protein
MTPGRFPPPWRMVENSLCFIVQDATGQNLAWFYFREDPAVARQAGVPLKDEARRMAVNFARLAELLGKLD